jgi:hypothetical protein
MALLIACRLSSVGVAPFERMRPAGQFWLAPSHWDEAEFAAPAKDSRLIRIVD